MLDLHDGMGTFPLRLRTREATLIRDGKLDLAGEGGGSHHRVEPSIDEHLGAGYTVTDKRRFADLSIKPAVGFSTELNALRANKSVDDLPPGLRPLAVPNPCLHWLLEKPLAIVDFIAQLYRVRIGWRQF